MIHGRLSVSLWPSRRDGGLSSRPFLMSGWTLWCDDRRWWVWWEVCHDASVGWECVLSYSLRLLDAYIALPKSETSDCPGSMPRAFAILPNICIDSAVSLMAVCEVRGVMALAICPVRSS